MAATKVRAKRGAPPAAAKRRPTNARRAARSLTRRQPHLEQRERARIAAQWPEGIDDAAAAAKAAGLHYANINRPGIRRRRAGKGWRYLGPDGQPIEDAATLARILALVIPPGYTDVWINPDPRGHIQATGRDARGRKQYRYHPRWRETRDETKFHRMTAFGRALPALRRRVDADLAQRGVSRERVLATVVRLLETTSIRVGNEEYARANDSYGLTTLRDDQVEVEGSEIHFTFRGKSGKEQEIDIRNRQLARIVHSCQDLPGQTLFTYLEAGEPHTIDSGDVNAYLHEILGDAYSAKDFRTWNATVFAAQELTRLGPAATKTAARANIVHAVDAVAARLRNTRAVCRQSYIHPAILDGYLDGTLLPALSNARKDREGHTAMEAAVLAYLERREGEEARGRADGK
jgi:DNA topoisomerase I